MKLESTYMYHLILQETHIRKIEIDHSYLTHSSQHARLFTGYNTSTTYKFKLQVNRGAHWSHEIHDATDRRAHVTAAPTR